MPIVGGGKHAAHCGDKKTTGSAARVEDNIIGLKVDEFTKKFGDVSRSEHDAQALTVAAAVRNKFAVKSSEVIFRRIVYHRVENIFGNEFGKKFQRGFVEVRIFCAEQRPLFNQTKLTEDAFLFYFGADVGALQMIFDVLKNFCAVGFNFVARELFDVKIFSFGQREQNCGNDQRLFVLSELPVISQVFVKSFGLPQNFFEFDFFGGLFAQNHAAIVAVNIFRRKIFERSSIKIGWMM